MEGSPTYKQRRRRSSVTPGVPNPVVSAAATPQSTTTAPSQAPVAYAAHKPSDLRRSMSNSVIPPVTEVSEPTEDSSQRATASFPAAVLPQKDLLHEMSRHGTPLSGFEENVDQNTLSLTNPQDELAALPNSETFDAAVQSSATNKTERYAPGPVRRARSATMMELGPYPQKSHSCPIPSCGRLFKRLEHLKR